MYIYVISIIFLIGNVYLHDVNNIPVSIIINSLIFIALYLKGYVFKFNFKIAVLILLCLISFGLTALFNSDIYYLYIILRNIIFLIVLYYIYISLDFKVFSNTTLFIVLLNNVITLGILLDFQPMISFSKFYTDLLNIDMRFDYRVSGITSGTLHASLLSVYAFIYSLYFINNKLLKIPLIFTLLFFMFIQSRSAIVLSVIAIFIYWLQRMIFKKSSNSIKNITISVCITILSLVIIFSNFDLISKYTPNFESTIGWQLSGLTDLARSDSLNHLNTMNETELNNFFESNHIIQMLFGNGKGNWKGEGSIETDTGFVVQLIGLGLIGSLILNILYIFMILRSLKLYKNRYFFMLITIFLVQIYMNYKSTSFIGFYYFNLFFIFYFITIWKSKSNSTA